MGIGSPRGIGYGKVYVKIVVSSLEESQGSEIRIEIGSSKVSVVGNDEGNFRAHHWEIHCDQKLGLR